MVDLISRKQAIELLDSAWVDGVEYRGNLHDEFEALPSIHKWISVKDDMPKEYESIFARFNRIKNENKKKEQHKNYKHLK